MVNTFLPYPDFTQTAKCLDYRRLGKQRVEARQIVNVIENPHSKAWKNHPAVAMWRGYTNALKLYFNIIVQEWINRGYVNNLPFYELTDKIEMPWWIDSDDFHFSHQASLMRKDPGYYSSKFFVPERYLSLGYIWPKIVEREQILEFSPITGKNMLLVVKPKFNFKLMKPASKLINGK